MSGIERRIKTFAFVNNCDLDKATRKVILQVAGELNTRTDTEGLYDELFGDVREQEK